LLRWSDGVASYPPVGKARLHGWTSRWALAHGIARAMVFPDGGKPVGLIVKAAFANDLITFGQVVCWW